MILTLPMPPNLLNGRGHWRTKHRAQKQYQAHLTYLRLAGDLPAPPADPMSRVAVTCTLHLCGCTMDADNAAGRAKWPMDWLVRSGYLKNDSPREVVSFTTRQVRVPKRADVRLVIELEAA